MAAFCGQQSRFSGKANTGHRKRGAWRNAGGGVPYGAVTLSVSFADSSPGGGAYGRPSLRGVGMIERRTVRECKSLQDGVRDGCCGEDGVRMEKYCKNVV